MSRMAEWMGQRKAAEAFIVCCSDSRVGHILGCDLDGARGEEGRRSAGRSSCHIARGYVWQAKVPRKLACCRNKKGEGAGLARG